MKFNLSKLNYLQFQELAKTFLDIGKAIFLGSVAAFFIPSLANKDVPIITLIVGLSTSLTFIAVGIILLSKGIKK